MSKKVANVQSSYIPWKGYFDIVNLVDEFILFDDLQYTKRDWRNRNAIKTSNGVRRRTRPMGVFADRTSIEGILFAAFTHENHNQGVSAPFPLTQNS